MRIISWESSLTDADLRPPLTGKEAELVSVIFDPAEPGTSLPALTYFHNTETIPDRFIDFRTHHSSIDF